MNCVVEVFQRSESREDLKDSASFGGCPWPNVEVSNCVHHVTIELVHRVDGQRYVIGMPDGPCTSNSSSQRARSERRNEPYKLVAYYLCVAQEGNTSIYIISCRPSRSKVDIAFLQPKY